MAKHITAHDVIARALTSSGSIASDLAQLWQRQIGAFILQLDRYDGSEEAFTLMIGFACVTESTGAIAHALKIPISTMSQYCRGDFKPRHEIERRAIISAIKEYLESRYMTVTRV